MKHFAITTLILLSGLMVLSSPKKNENSTAKELVHQIEKSIEGDHVIYLEIKNHKKGFHYSLKIGCCGASTNSQSGVYSNTGVLLERKVEYSHCTPPTTSKDYCSEAELVEKFTHGKTTSITGFFAKTDPMTHKDRKRFKFNDVKSFKTTVKVAGEEIFKNYMPTPLPKKYRKPISIDLRSGYY